MSTTHRRPGYHHGDLPDRLMCLALQHIADVGTQKLSLRALAREAGVSPTAPYRHFASKQCLLAALATQGFQELEARTDAAGLAAQSVEDRFLAMGLAYVRFAQDNPTLYQLMFGSGLSEFSAYEMLHTAVASAYGSVDRVLAQLIAEKDLPLEVEQLGGVVWGALHGIASLLISDLKIGDGTLRPMQSLAALRADPEVSIEYLLRSLIAEPKCDQAGV
ncbi:MAG: TetR/AcrR family transcriptional regulator [Pseudomonadota bacterium]